MRRIVFSAFLLALGAMTVACGASGSSSGTGLTGKVWQLTAITEKVPAFQGVVPADQQASYTIEFATAGTFSAKADCNVASGQYTTTTTGGMTITPGPMTLAACPEGSLGPQYIDVLSDAASYAIASGQLTITATDGDTLVYK
jgi:heat shock protein HslJ